MPLLHVADSSVQTTVLVVRMEETEFLSTIHYKSDPKNCTQTSLGSIIITLVLKLAPRQKSTS
jgi:hypothetical protein